MRAYGVESRTDARLHNLALVGDLASNAAYDALIGLGDSDGERLAEDCSG